MVLQVALALGGAGAAVILIPLLGDGAAIGGLVADHRGHGARGALRRAAGSASGGWWNMMATGAVLALIGLPLALAVETLGGLVTAFGGILVAVAVAFALPGRAA